MSTETVKTSPWSGTNIYGQILLLAASAFGGMSQDTSGLIVAGGAAAVASVLAFRNWVITAKFSLDKSWIKDPNNLAYLTAVVVGISPKAAELIPGAADLFTALTTGNWGGIVSAGVSILSVVWYAWIKKK